MRVLVVDDHAETRQLLARSFEQAAHSVEPAGSCAAALTAIERSRFDLIVLDVMLPDGSGLDLCRKLRALPLATPVLLLTARGQVRDRVEGLDAGADDYLPKPFAVSELLARARALGRRGPALREAQVKVGPFTIDLVRRRVCREGTPVALTAREFAIVEVMALRRGAIVSRDDLVESVWGEDSDSARASLDVLLTRIRRKLGRICPIRTVRGMGYALEPRP